MEKFYFKKKANVLNEEDTVNNTIKPDVIINTTIQLLNKRASALKSLITAYANIDSADDNQKKNLTSAITQYHSQWTLKDIQSLGTYNSYVEQYVGACDSANKKNTATAAQPATEQNNNQNQQSTNTQQTNNNQQTNSNQNQQSTNTQQTNNNQQNNQNNQQ